MEKIISTIAQEEPFMIPLIRKFGNNLPERLKELKSDFVEKNWQTLARDAHSLVIAESYGYPQLSQYAEQLELAALEKKLDLIETLLINIESIIPGIIEGLPQE